MSNPTAFQIVILIYFAMPCLVHGIVIRILGNTALYIMDGYRLHIHWPGEGTQRPSWWTGWAAHRCCGTSGARGWAAGASCGGRTRGKFNVRALAEAGRHPRLLAAISLSVPEEPRRRGGKSNEVNH